MSILTVRLTRDVEKKIEDKCRKMKITKSKYVRRIIENELSRSEEKYSLEDVIKEIRQAKSELLEETQTRDLSFTVFALEHAIFSTIQPPAGKSKRDFFKEIMEHAESKVAKNSGEQF
jgi:predicted DNA-binding protein